MSLILEALKKSEARRQLGEAPGLGTPFTVAPRRRSALPLLIVLIVVAAGFGAWYLRGAKAPAAADNNTVTSTAPAAGAAPAARTPTVAAQPAVPSQAPTPPRAAPPGTAAGSAPAPVKPPAALGVISPAAPPPATATAGPDPGVAAHPFRGERALGNRGEQRAAFEANRAAAGRTAATPMNAQRAPAPAAAPMPGAVATPGAARPGAGVPRPAVTAPVNTAATPGGAQATGPAPAAAGRAAATPAAAPNAPPGAPAPAAPATSNLPMYYELPYDVRRDLPALVISMHVFAAAPAQRFVVVDGERKSEGDTLKDGLTVREIRTDGVVFEFRGTRFFYPRPGR